MIKASINITIDNDLLEKVELLAKKQMRSRSNTIEWLISEKLQELEKDNIAYKKYMEDTYIECD